MICLLFAGMLLYLCAPLIRIASAPQVATVQEYVRQRTHTLRGIIVREETPIPRQAISAVPVAADGQAVAAGSTIAVFGRQSIPAPTAGIYVRETDGYEYLTADMLAEITPTGVDRLLRSDAADTPYLGKIIRGNGWLLAAAADTSCADLLQEGRSLELTVQAEEPFTLTAAVIHISPSENGRCAVVFRCIDRLQHTLHLRHLTVSLSDESMEGLCVPTQTIHTDEAGSFVYTLSASKAEKTYVTILSEENDVTVVSKDSSADTLCAGDTIIVSAPDLKEGLQ